LRIHPKQLHSGEQTVAVYVAAPLQPAPAKNHLEFHIDPPQDTDTIHFQKPAPLALDLIGPPAARLIATQEGHHTQTLSRTVPYGDSMVDVPALFQLTGPVTRTFAAALRVETRGEIVTDDLAVFQAVSLPVSLSDSRSSSYLFDESHTVPFEVVPVPAGSAVTPLRLQARVTQQAPFKQHLFLALSVMIVIAVPYFLVRLAVSMRPSSPFDDPDAGDHSLSSEP
jgi:hypothetical protein